MVNYYSAERNIQMLVSLLKEHNIKKIIISPGATNVTFVGSVQNDSFFELYSCVDERSAAYMACGLAEESGEPVALNCTMATASRNYMPGLTEAFYRKLPILAITSSHPTIRKGHLFPQMIDRSILPNDVVRKSVTIPAINNTNESWSCNTKINEALLELYRDGGGPVHINLETQYSKDFSIKELPKERVIKRYCLSSLFPEIPEGKIAIFIGAHKAMSIDYIEKFNYFCKMYNAVVLCDQTSNYRGEYRILANIVCDQKQYPCAVKEPDLLIHIGNISGAYMKISPKEVWRINPDGEIRDAFQKLTKVFEMDEIKFFEHYTNNNVSKASVNSYLKEWQKEIDDLRSDIPELPFSNLWIAKQTAHLLPSSSVLHLGILNTLRSWNYFETPSTVRCYTNTGGFGIDGCVSSLIGASFAKQDKLYFGIVGDLAFFYDINALGNRHIGKNIRLMVINNGRGIEFRNYFHRAEHFGEEADKFMAAAHHFGNKSNDFIKHYAEDLGFEYLCASNKKEYLDKLERFVSNKMTEKPILFEIFTDTSDESEALRLMHHIKVDPKCITTWNTKNFVKQNAKKFVKSILGEDGFCKIKKIIKR